ncbi:uncharacterized protein METZ01_LOCUS248726 [marine metagenome]|uniref:Uncharacterized protein n=1 Tax=marine metagenome TaxID=408172 RepID=A0A382I982_9ZZZZ
MGHESHIVPALPRTGSFSQTEQERS